MPPDCRPECVVSAECSQDKACQNLKCIDPCPGTCGSNARCQVLNHNPICSCTSGYTGDPFLRCFIEDSKLLLKQFMCQIYLSKHSRTFRRADWRSLHTLTLRPLFILPSQRQYSSMFLLAQLHWKVAELPSRMYNQR